MRGAEPETPISLAPSYVHLALFHILTAQFESVAAVFIEADCLICSDRCSLKRTMRKSILHRAGKLGLIEVGNPIAKLRRASDT